MPTFAATTTMDFVPSTGSDLFRELLEAAPDALVIVDETGRIVLVNAQVEHVFGWPRDELVGRPVEVLIPRRYASAHEHHRTAYAGTPRVRRMGQDLELYGVRRDGSEFPVEVSLSPLRTGQGVLVCSAIRDVTDRKRADVELAARAEALARSNEELEQFAYVASHDLQEPLRTVASFTQLLARRFADAQDADAKDFVAHILDGVRRMQGLIQDLLAYSRAVRQERDFVETDLGAVLDGVLEGLGASVAQTQARVTRDALPVVLGDPAQLAQLLQNLVSNALKFRGAGEPRIHVGAERRAGEWLVYVRDNGIGIDPEFFGKLFVIFQRLHTRERYPGSGIGLAICKKIVHRHGGRIWVESTGTGQGSTFYFTLPDVRASGTAARPPGTGAVRGSTSARP